MPLDADHPSDPHPGRSAIVVPLDLPIALARVRRRWDTAAQAGARPHVTIVYPFLPCADLGPRVRVDLQALAASIEPFDVRFGALRRFTRLVWIEPDSPAPFIALTAAVVERWPDHRPYSGAHEAVIPHLTVVGSDDATVPLDEVEDISARGVPFATRAERLELWCQDQSARWRVRWRIPLGLRR